MIPNVHKKTVIMYMFYRLFFYIAELQLGALDLSFKLGLKWIDGLYFFFIFDFLYPILFFSCLFNSVGSNKVIEVVTEYVGGDGGVGEEDIEDMLDGIVKDSVPLLPSPGQ